MYLKHKLRQERNKCGGISLRLEDSSVFDSARALPSLALFKNESSQRIKFLYRDLLRLNDALRLRDCQSAFGLTRDTRH